MGKIADIMSARGQLDEALRIRREESLPVYQKLGDIRERAVTMGKIADIMSARGQLDEALRIRREEELPVYHKLGDLRSVALTMGRIANILAVEGQLDEALRIRREESVPVLEKLRDRRELFLCEWSIAKYLQKRFREGDLAEARRLAQKALQAAIEMKLPEAQALEQFLHQLPERPATTNGKPSAAAP
jgi:tetratricopeptide (TPR) repeat protein